MTANRSIRSGAIALALVIGWCGAAVAAFTGECGQASWYEFTTKTASGETASPDKLTAAHPSLPFGTIVRVENLANGKFVEVRINDRGPHTGGRIIDVTRAAARTLGLIDAGTGTVRITAPGSTGPKPSCR